MHLFNKNVNAGGPWLHIGVRSLIKGSFMTGTTVSQFVLHERQPSTQQGSGVQVDKFQYICSGDPIDFL